MHRLFRKRSILESQKLVRRERAAKGFKLAVIIILLAVLIWGLSVLSRARGLNVQQIIVSGNSAVSTADVMSAAQHALAGSYYWIFPRSNIFWYPKNEILDSLKYSSAWIDSISIDRKGLTAVAINIKERVPVAVWCGLDSASPAPCKLMDAHGYIFAPAPDFSGTAYIRLYGPLTSADWHGAKYFSENGVTHVLEMIKNLSGLGFTPVSVQTVADLEGDSYEIVLQSGTKILLKSSDLASGIISNISALLTQKIFMQSAARNFSDLTSLDMRFGNKIFYKFKNSAPTSSSTATSTKI